MRQFQFFLMYSILVMMTLLSCGVQEQSNQANASIDLVSSDLKERGANDLTTKVTPPRVDSILEFKSLITAMYEDSRGDIWIGSHCDGVCKFNGEVFTYYTVEQGLPHFSTHPLGGRDVPMGNSIRYIQEDKEGNMIFGTGDGISKYNGQGFTTIHPEAEPILITDFINQNITPERQHKETDMLWFGGPKKNGVYRYDGQKLLHLTFPEDDFFANGSPSQYATYSIGEDSLGNVWFGTEGGGIMRYDGRTFSCVNAKEEKGIVRSFFQDDTGRMWISNVLQGVYYYDTLLEKTVGISLVNFTKEKGMYTLSETRGDNTLDESKMLDGVQSIQQDRDGNLWFGSYANGIWKYDGEEITHFNTDNGLPSNTVKTIFKDKSGELWFGMGEWLAHLYSFNGSSFERFGG